MQMQIADIFLEEIIHVAGERGSSHLHENICRGREETWKQRKETRNLFGCRQQPFLHNGAKICVESHYNIVLPNPNLTSKTCMFSGEIFNIKCFASFITVISRVNKNLNATFKGIWPHCSSAGLYGWKKIWRDRLSPSFFTAR